MTGLSQATLYRHIEKGTKMKEATFAELVKAIALIQNESYEYNVNSQFDEKVDIAMEDEVPYQSNNKTIREQAEALKMSSEHIGKLIAQVSMLMEENKELKDQLNKTQKELWESKMHA